ncbi:hypothetical protein K469DRAFT_696202 [Zopfia rhizophila CBS 207.26]|uniref:Uncharacterized protein n=1 Tax=Zopfia rhizophila CBS 207.26 TaxID=1314779 RepID=A0A6A6DEV5_9PEZI|nr:hypothetical protein K469DRAFT_696202 [Zopfia rhizophila CBS 207.26]
MAPPKNPVARRSTRTPKPSTRKRAQSNSISQPPPSSQRSKKSRTANQASRTPVRPPLSTLPQPDIADNEGQARQPIKVSGNKEGEDIASSIIDNNAAEATQPKEQLKKVDNDHLEEDLMKYPSV